MLLNREAYYELGGFDPEAFPCESLDLCWRARLAGARVLVVPDARARHEEAAEKHSDAGHLEAVGADGWFRKRG